MGVPATKGESRAMWAARAIGLILAVMAARVIWLSGFDQGADVAMCVDASFRNGGDVITLAKDDPACIRAKAYESNPLWAFRRRGGEL